MRSILVALAALSLGGSSAHAQTVPAFSVEATGGFGRHTQRTLNTYYIDDPVALVRVAATIRLGPAGNVRPILTVEHTPDCTLGLCGDSGACPIAPDGTCERDFPMPSGNAIALGVAGNWHNSVIGSLSGGTAWYAQRAWYADVSAVLPWWSHVAMVADARRIATTDRRGDRIWLLPISLGLQVY